MSKLKITAIVAVIAIPVLALVQYEGSTRTLIKRFPDIPKDVVRRVHGEMLRDALSGEYADQDLNDDDYDALFLAKALQHLN